MKNKEWLTRKWDSYEYFWLGLCCFFSSGFFNLIFNVIIVVSIIYFDRWLNRPK